MPSFPLLSPALPLQGHDTVALQQAMAALAAGGDLAMGQPPGASERAARLALRVARAAGASPGACAHAALAARLRWCGAGATAAGAARLLGDDVGARHALLARLPALRRDDALAAVDAEVAAMLAAMLGLPAAVEQALGASPGLPQALRADDDLIHYVALGSDLEVLARLHGPDAALAAIDRLAGARYPASLAALAREQAPDWLREQEDDATATLLPSFLPASAPLTLVADAFELKLPWLAGYARRVALLAQRAAAQCGLTDEQQRLLVRAALLHGIGRAAVPNALWQRPRRLGASELDAVRRVPYRTALAIGAIPGLEQEAQLAAQAYERLDGSGYFRGMGAADLDMGQRLLAAATVLVALRAPRPWRAPHPPAAAAALLAAQVTGGRLDRDAVAAVQAAAHALGAAPGQSILSARETEVLRRLSLGQGPREAGRALRLSAGAIHAHAENAFHKLGCSTLPAATLRALTLALV